MLHRKIEIGNTEKHVIEYKWNFFSMREEIRINGEIVFKQYMERDLDKTFEVGLREKHRVRVKSFLLERFGLKSPFYVDGKPL